MTTPKPQPPKPRGKLWWIAVGLAGLLALWGVASFRANRDDSNPSEQSGRNVAAIGKIGTAVRDGKFEFVVRSVQCGVGQIGPDYADERAQGQFCLVSLTVKNIGDKPQTMPDGAQKGFDTNGAQYGTNSTAGLHANQPNDQVWQTEISPGKEVTGTIVYDLPRGAELARLELHDSLASPGVKVDLR